MTTPAPYTTPVYGLKAVPVGGPAYLTRQYLQDNVDTIEAALLTRGVSPAEAEEMLLALGAVNNRLNLVEPDLEEFVAARAAGWFTDTGWQNISLATGITALVTGGVASTPQWKYRGGEVRLRGAVNGAGATITPGMVVGTLPATYTVGGVTVPIAPATYQRQDGATSGSTETIRRLNVDHATRQIIANGSGTGNITWHSLDQVKWVH